jgi:hypothetical protein
MGTLHAAQRIEHPHGKISLQCLAADFLFLPLHLGWSEIQNLGVPSISHEEIRRVDVPVHNPLRMVGIPECS